MKAGPACPPGTATRSRVGGPRCKPASLGTGRLAAGKPRQDATCGSATFSLDTSVGWDVVGSGGGYGSHPPTR